MGRISNYVSFGKRYRDIKMSGSITNSGVIISTGTVTSVNVCNSGAGYRANTTAGNMRVSGAVGGSISGIVGGLYGTPNITLTPTLMTLLNPFGEKVLTISSNGDVTVKGSTNEAAKIFLNVLSHHIDKEAAGKAALARSYKRAIQRCLRQIKSMNKEEFIALLETEIDNRNSKAVLLYLQEPLEDIEE